MSCRWRVSPRLQVAIDGPSGSGKGTVAALLGKALALPVLDSGLLYRCIAYLARGQMENLEEDAVAAMLEEVVSRMQWREQSISIDGHDIGAELRSEAIGTLASQIAGMYKVRQGLLPLQRRVAEAGCVMDGRDIGTVVLPHAQVKFFLTASVRERARRRWLQLQAMGVEANLDDVIADMKKRDRRDSERTHAPLEQAPEAIRIDSTTLRIDEVVDRMLNILERRGLIQQSGG